MIFRILVLATLLQTLPALAQQTCKPNQGQLALVFMQMRARLAVAAGQCMGYARDVDAQQFTRFLSRHKEWALRGDEWSGTELLRVQQAKASAKSIGSQHYVQLIHQEQETARQASLTKYCGEALEQYRAWVQLDATGLSDHLRQVSCAKPRVEVAITPTDN